MFVFPLTIFCVCGLLLQLRLQIISVTHIAVAVGGQSNTAARASNCATCVACISVCVCVRVSCVNVLPAFVTLL